MEAMVVQEKLGRSRLSEHFRRRRRLYFIVVIILVLISLTTVILFMTRGSNSNSATQKQLEDKLTTAEKSADGAGVVNAASQLIDGASNGTLRISSQELAQIHLEKAQALTSTQQYKSAIPDYEKAAQLDSSLKVAALGGEVQAMYNAGERQQIIPILQELVSAEKKITDDPVASQMAAMYQNDIDAIQNNQEVSF